MTVFQKRGGLVTRNMGAHDPIPVYFKVQSAIREEIEKGQWKPGDKIPTERVLADKYRVSIGTIKKSMQDLIYEGYLYRVQGKGTFVAEGTLRWEGLRYYRTQRNFLDQDHDFTIKFLELRKIDSAEPFRCYLNLRSSQSLFELKRFIVIDGRPTVFTVSYLPVKTFKDLDKFPQSRFEKLALYLALEESYGVRNMYNQELLGAVPADEELAGRLGVAQGSPLLSIEMLAFTYKDRPYEYRRAFCVTDQVMVYREY